MATVQVMDAIAGRAVVHFHIFNLNTFYILTPGKPPLNFNINTI